MNDNNEQIRKGRIERSISEHRCAQCDADLDETGIVGSGSFSDGLFCSLDCFTKFNYEAKGACASNKRTVH